MATDHPTLFATTDVAVITVTTRDYLYRARALMTDVAHLLPGAARLVYCVDALPATLAADEPFTLLPVAAMGIPRYRQLAFALPPVGLCCAVKPHATLDALRRGAAKVLYLDNDIALYRPPDAALAALADAAFVLTPHLTEPLPAGAQPSEDIIRRYGTWNAGIFAAANTAAARAFLTWWSGVMNDPRRLSGDTGWDQPWLEFAPAFMPSVHVLRDPGYNVGPWNLASRPIERTSTGWTAAGQPLTAFHFSWFDENAPARYLRPGSTCNLVASPSLGELGRAYADALQRSRRPAESAWRCEFATYADGQTIDAAHRAFFRDELWDRVSAEADPFDPAWPTPAGARFPFLRAATPPPASAARRLAGKLRRALRP